MYLLNKLSNYLLFFFCLDELYPQHFAIMIDSFQDAVKSLSEFACNSNFPDISMESIRLIRTCAVFVDEKPNLFMEHVMEEGHQVIYNLY